MFLSSLIAELDLLDDWEERYSYIIDLGKRLPSFPVDKLPSYRVDGCMSEVWLYCEYGDGILRFWGDSDAFIVKGLIAILFQLYDGRSCDEVLGIDAEHEFRNLGLDSHLSPNRRNGFFSMVSRIRSYAEANSV